MTDFDDWMQKTYDYVADVTEAGFCYGDMKDAYFARIYENIRELSRLRAFAKDVVESPEMTAFYLFKHGIIDENGKPKMNVVNIDNIHDKDKEIKRARMEALGWMYAFACKEIDYKRDLRGLDVSLIIGQAVCELERK